MEDDSMLKFFLDMSVPLRVMELKQRGGPAKDDFERVHSYLPLLGEEGNFLWMRSEKKGTTAKVANAVADAIAVLSFSPGGVTLFGRHWESRV
ncbi:MAG: hypothetical protein DRH50_10965 [Deltaproteobacteria bacterium]|nr:MAG: hypothetical protein DRH50_10965 [Deltaproteobacteria bacterium]